MSHSQGGEEAIILEYFQGKPPGKFLDIGAYDGITFSNTYALALDGWGGLCIEPAPTAFEKLKTLYTDRKDVQLSRYAITFANEATITFHDASDCEKAPLVSSAVQKHVELWETQADFKVIEVPNIHFNVFMAQYGEHWNLVNLDAEGLSATILLNWPLETNLPDMIVVEHDQRCVELANKCRPFGLHPRYLDGNNMIFAL